MSTAESVNKLVLRNGADPRRYKRVLPPRVALHVDYKQRLPHDILRVDSALHLPPEEATHKTGYGAQEKVVGLSDACDCRSQQPGKFVFVPAVQTCLPLQLRSRAAGRYLANRFCSAHAGSPSRNRAAGKP
jgi:hypothetical protein